MCVCLSVCVYVWVCVCVRPCTGAYVCARVPQLLWPVSHVQVLDGTRSVKQLNELEYIDGEIWANIWQTECIARINPETGLVTCAPCDNSPVTILAKRVRPRVFCLGGLPSCIGVHGLVGRQLALLQHILGGM